MLSKLEEQALKPRGSNPREKLQFIISWYEKTAAMKPSDDFQDKFFTAMQEWIPEGRQILGLDDSQLVPAIQEMINVANCQTSSSSNWPKNSLMRCYLAIELQRVIA